MRYVCNAKIHMCTHITLVSAHICLVMAHLHQSERIVHKCDYIGTESWESTVMMCSQQCIRLTKASDHARLPTKHLLDQSLVLYHSSITSLGVLLTFRENYGCIKTNSDLFYTIKSIIKMNRITPTAHPHIYDPQWN